MKLTKGDIFMPKGQPNKRYTPEFKIKVVETMRDEKLNMPQYLVNNTFHNSTRRNIQL